MRKLKPFTIHCMTPLSREEMVKINGGEFLIGTCTLESVGERCFISAEGGVHTGTCSFYTVTYTEAGGASTYIYKYPFCKKD